MVILSCKYSLASEQLMIDTALFASWKSHFMASSCHSQASLSRSSHVWHIAALTRPVHSTSWAGDTEQCNFVSEMLPKGNVFVFSVPFFFCILLENKGQHCGTKKCIWDFTNVCIDRHHSNKKNPILYTSWLSLLPGLRQFSCAACVCFEVSPDLPGN